MWWQKVKVACGFAPARGPDGPVENYILTVPNPVEQGYIADPGHPVEQLVLRPVLGAKHALALQLRDLNADWLAPWEVGVPTGFPADVPTLSQFRRRVDRQFVDGAAVYYLVYLDEQPVGAVSVTSIERGASQTAVLGYWVARSYAGLGIMRTAVAEVTTFLLHRLNLHRVEVYIRPDNPASLGLVESLGFLPEGVRQAYLWVDGAWRDHLVYTAFQESWWG